MRLSQTLTCSGHPSQDNKNWNISVSDASTRCQFHQFYEQRLRQNPFAKKLQAQIVST
jgi:hypothetical protein